MAYVYWCSHCDDKAVGCHVLADNRQKAQRCCSLETKTDFFLVQAEESNIYHHESSQEDITEPLVINAVVFYLYNSLSESCIQIVTELYTPCRKTIRCSSELEWQFSLEPSRINGEWKLSVAVDYRGTKDNVTVILSE